MTKVRLRVLALAAAVGLLGLVAVIWTSTSKERFVPLSNTAAATITEQELSSASAVRLFFGHQSVGRNILDGVSAVYAEKRVASPSITEVRAGDPKVDGFAHTAIGQNGDPVGKLAAFDSMLRGGWAETADVALMKFCYVDIGWNTDVDALFARYRETLDALERDYPEVTFLHVTTPLTTGSASIKDRVKVVIGRNDNAARERYNQLLRQTYGSRVFDLAVLESTAPDGTRGAVLYQGYSSDDGEHLNPTGAAVVAAGLLRMLATLDQT
jgi:hypothetical protein